MPDTNRTGEVQKTKGGPCAVSHPLNTTQM